jgi:hypothetical protein
LLKKQQKKKPLGWAPWLMPIILTTEEADLRRITVGSQPQAVNLQDPISKNPSQK